MLEKNFQRFKRSYQNPNISKTLSSMSSCIGLEAHGSHETMVLRQEQLETQENIFGGARDCFLCLWIAREKLGTKTFRSPNETMVLHQVSKTTLKNYIFSKIQGFTVWILENLQIGRSRFEGSADPDSKIDRSSLRKHSQCITFLSEDMKPRWFF